MNPKTRHFIERLPGTIGVREGHGFSLPVTTSVADLPTCEVARGGEKRWVPGGVGEADVEVTCTKGDDDVWAWQEAGSGEVGAHSHAGTQTIAIPIGDGVNTVPSGIWNDFSMPMAGTWTKWRILGTKYTSGSTGSAVIDIWKTPYASHPPVLAGSITASDKPTLSAADQAEGSSLTGWTTDFDAGDVFRIHIDSATTVSLLTLVLEYEPTILTRSAVAIPFGDSVSVPSTGVWRDFSMPVGGTWKKWRILGTRYVGGATTGSVVFDIFKEEYADHPATILDTITAAAKPTMTAASKAESTALTGWTTTFSAGDVFRVNIDSVSDITLGTLILEYERES